MGFGSNAWDSRHFPCPMPFCRFAQKTRFSTTSTGEPIVFANLFKIENNFYITLTQLQKFNPKLSQYL